MMNAKELRAVVVENALELGRVSKDAVGKDTYDTLTSKYQAALDALTEWASKDYAHECEQTDISNAFEAVKAILNLFATDEDRIIIDQATMRTMRDVATKPKRLYSKEYTEAEKARKHAKKVMGERYADLLTLKCPEIGDEESTEEYIARIEELELDLVVKGIDMLDMFKKATAVCAVKTQAVENIKAKGAWTWKRPVAVTVNEFAELVENYIADCLIDNYNIKPSKVVREEQAEARKAAREAKKNA